MFGFLHLQALADVLLDTIHFGGGNTSLEAFAFGTPVVTLPGRHTLKQTPVPRSQSGPAKSRFGPWGDDRPNLGPRPGHGLSGHKGTQGTTPRLRKGESVRIPEGASAEVRVKEWVEAVSLPAQSGLVPETQMRPLPPRVDDVSGGAREEPLRLTLPKKNLGPPRPSTLEKSAGYRKKILTPGPPPGHAPQFFILGRLILFVLLFVGSWFLVYYAVRGSGGLIRQAFSVLRRSNN